MPFIKYSICAQSIKYFFAYRRKQVNASKHMLYCVISKCFYQYILFCMRFQKGHQYEKLRKPCQFLCLGLALAVTLSNVAFRENFDLLENRQFSWSLYGRSHLMGRSKTEKRNPFSVYFLERFFTC